MTDKDIVERIGLLLESKVYFYPKRRQHWKDYYVTAVTGYKAVQWMMTLFSLMGERRREKIIECLNAWKKNKRGQVNPYTHSCGHVKVAGRKCCYDCANKWNKRT